MKKYYLVLLALSVCSMSVPQISDIIRLPVQNPSQSIKEFIKVYSLYLKTKLMEFLKANRYEVYFNSVGLASGIYIYRMKVNDFITSKKMVLIK